MFFETLRFLIANPTASLYNNRTQMLAAIEFACLDILGQRWGVSVFDFKMPPPPTSGDAKIRPVFVGYGRIPGLNGEGH